MHQIEASDASQFDEFEWSNVIASGAKTRQVVKLARRMKRSRFVPPSQIRSSAFSAPIDHGARLGRSSRILWSPLALTTPSNPYFENRSRTGTPSRRRPPTLPLCVAASMMRSVHAELEGALATRLSTI